MAHPAPLETALQYPPSPRRPAFPDDRPRRVLVVDDHPDTADTLGMLLERLGYAASVAYDGLEACRQAQQSQPHLVIIDLHMPLVDGMAAARAIRACRWQNDRRPLLMAFTADGLPATRRAAFDAGFDLHFVKPLPEGEFERVMADVLPLGPVTADPANAA